MSPWWQVTPRSQASRPAGQQQQLWALWEGLLLLPVWGPIYMPFIHHITLNVTLTFLAVPSLVSRMWIHTTTQDWPTGCILSSQPSVLTRTKWWVCMPSSNVVMRLRPPPGEHREFRRWFVHTMEYNSAFKKKEILIYTTTSVSLGDILLSEISQTWRTNILWFHLHEVFRVIRLLKTDRQQNGGCQGLGGWGVSI